MKKITLMLLVLIPSLASGQTKKFELGLTVGNNGLFSDVQKDFYDETYLGFFYDSYESKSSSIKYTLSARYLFSENISAKLKIGYAKHHDEYEQEGSYFYRDSYEINQSVVSFNPSLCFSKNLDKFEIITGIEIPLLLAGDHTAETQGGFDSLI